MSSAALERPALIAELASAVGGQSVVVVFDVKRAKPGEYTLWTHNGQRRAAATLLPALAQAEALGAGEIVVNSIDRDGRMDGYDLELARLARGHVGLPMTFLGGAGTLDHLRNLFDACGVVAAGAGSLFVFKGPHRAVLINYPNPAQKDELVRSTLARPAVDLPLDRSRQESDVRLLLVSQYFWPEAFIINDLVRTLTEQGHSVLVATGKPNYPDGRVFEGYRAEGVVRETFGPGVPVVRVPMRPRGVASGLNLMLNYLSFAYSGAIRFPRLAKGFQPDAILVYAPSPITSAIAAIPLKWVKRSHLAIWVQDLWPESLAATGHVRNPLILGAAGLMVRAIYRCADTLLVQSRAFAEAVADYAPAEKIIYYPNSLRVAPADVPPDPLPVALVETLTSGFCAVFAGNIGSVQAIPTLVDAAEALRGHAGVCIVVIGSGSMAEWLRSEQGRRGLTNLKVFDRLPSTSMPEVYRLSSALLLTLRRNDALARTVPSKLQSYLAAGKPVIAAVGGEGNRIVRESGAGIICDPESPAALAEAIVKMSQESLDSRNKMGLAAKAFFAAHFEMTGQAKRLVEILEGRIHNGESAA